MATAPQEFPQAFGKYTLLRKLARGGMAELFLARQAGSPKLYVIKRILPDMAMDKQFLAMFLTEARVAAQLIHPNIISIYDLGQEGTHIYQAMEYIDGIDLERLGKLCGGKLPPDVMARICVDLCDALHFANRSIDMSTKKPLNVIHRDVTPGNVMITRQGVVKLVDFGVAKATAQLERTKAGVVKGKFRYMSPEQLQLQELDGRSDLFSVGVLLYEMSTGTKPFDRPQVIEIIRALTTWNPPPPAKAVKGYPKAISDVIERALAKDREKRFSDGTQMKQALEKALATIADPTDVRDFISQYLPPPIPELAAPPPPKPRQLLELDDDDDDDSATMMGMPVFNAQGGVVGHRSLSASPAARNSAAKSVPPPLPNADEELIEDDEDSEDRWDDLLPRNASAPAAPGGHRSGEFDHPLTSRESRRAKSPSPARALQSPSRTRPPAMPDDDEIAPAHHGRHAVRPSADRWQDEEEAALPARGRQSGRRPSSVDKAKPAARPTSGRRSMSSVSKSKISGSQIESAAEANDDEDDDDVPLDWRPSRDVAIKIEEEERLALEEPPDLSKRKKWPLVVVLIVLALGVGGGIAYFAQQQKAAEPAPVVGGKGRLAIDGVGFVLLDGRTCHLPCVRNVDANTPMQIVHGKDPRRSREVTVEPNQEVRLSIDDL